MNIKKALAKFFLSVEDLNNPAREAKRIKACKACPKLRADTFQCGVCGCFMDIKATLKRNIDPDIGKVVTTHCPLGKWGDMKTANEYRKYKGEPMLLMPGVLAE